MTKQWLVSSDARRGREEGNPGKVPLKQLAGGGVDPSKVSTSRFPPQEEGGRQGLAYIRGQGALRHELKQR